MATHGRTPFRETQNFKRPHTCLPQLQRKKRPIQMKTYPFKALAAFALTALGLMLTGCQQAPPAASAAPAATAAPAPATPVPIATSESSSSTRSVEVKPDDSKPGVASEKTVTKDSSTTTQQR
jgi:hypothetical protein